MKKILLHVCCGPCSTYPINYLAEQFDVTAYFFGPNIHPQDEYQKRLNAFLAYCQKNNINYIEEEYIPDVYHEKIKKHEDNKAKRCPLCYELRLEQTAKKARELNMDYFTSTLLISPHQDINLIKNIGENLSAKYEINFFTAQNKDDKKKYKGFRPGFTLGRKIAKKENMYSQEYCGCIFSSKGL